MGTDTYYFPNPKYTEFTSPYLSDNDIIETPTAAHPFVQTLLPGLYDEETHALLHIDPYLDLMMQSQPLTYAFTNASPLFNKPDRFVHPKPSLSRMDGFGITQHRFDTNGNLIDTRRDSPVDYVSKSLAKQLRQLHLDGHRVYTPELPQRSILSSNTVFDAPWWTSDSIYDSDEQVGVLPVYRSSVTFMTNVPAASQEQSEILIAPVEGTSKHGEIVGSGMQCETGTQYEPSILPRILIDAITGTDEMERDLRNAAVSDFVDQMIDSLVVSTIADIETISVATNTICEIEPTSVATNTGCEKEVQHLVDNTISCAVDGPLDTLKSPEHEYEFVNSAEVVE